MYNLANKNTSNRLIDNFNVKNKYLNTEEKIQVTIPDISNNDITNSNKLLGIKKSIIFKNKVISTLLNKINISNDFNNEFNDIIHTSPPILSKFAMNQTTHNSNINNDIYTNKKTLARNNINNPKTSTIPNKNKDLKHNQNNNIKIILNKLKVDKEFITKLKNNGIIKRKNLI